MKAPSKGKLNDQFIFFICFQFDVFFLIKNITPIWVNYIKTLNYIKTDSNGGTQKFAQILT